MVRSFEQFRAPPLPAAIVGGFVDLPINHLLAVWFACQGLELGTGHLRAYFAAIEMVKRRSFAPERIAGSYDYAELARLLSVTQPRARLLIHGLVANGLLAWSDSAITFPEPPPLPDALLAPFARTIGGGRGTLTVPRRVLRFLAHRASAATAAVALGALFRCLSRRRGRSGSWGRISASWIVRAFRIGERQVKAARKHLVSLGWLMIAEGDNRQNAINREGRAYRVNLDWSATLAPSAPPRPAPAAPSAPPLMNLDPPREEDKNQDPASGGPAGDQLGGGEGGPEPPMVAGLPAATPPIVAVSPPPSRPSAPTTMPTSPAPGSPAIPSSTFPAATSRPSPAVLGPIPAPVDLPPPRLGDVRIEDLKDTGRLLDLHRQAVDGKLVGPSEADRLKVVAAAERALDKGQANPPGLFAWLVRKACWGRLSDADEDRANARIKAFLRGSEPARVATRSGRPPGVPGLSDNARLVREIGRAFTAKGYRGDPFPQLRRHDPSWTKERWDAALAELGPA